MFILLHMHYVKPFIGCWAFGYINSFISFTHQKENHVNE